MSARWSLGVLIGLPIVGLLLLLCLVGVAGGLWLWRQERKERRERGERGYPYDEHLGPWTTFGAFGVAIVVLIIAGFAYYPWVGEYHKWQPTSGTVTAVSNRFLGDGKSTTQRFVVTLDGVGDRACDDTRCSLVKTGDRLTLSCKRHWQWSGTPGYDCNYVKDERS